MHKVLLQIYSYKFIAMIVMSVLKPGLPRTIFTKQKPRKRVLGANTAICWVFFTTFERSITFKNEKQILFHKPFL
jgi:hypothetical protein